MGAGAAKMAERPVGVGSVRGFRGTPTRGPSRRRAVIVARSPILSVALEHLLVREGYEVGAPEAFSGPVMLLAGAPNGGFHVFETRDPAGAVAEISNGELRGAPSRATGVHAFLPEPFGAWDVVRVVRAVGGFDGRKKSGFGRGMGKSADNGEVECQERSTTG